MAKLLVAVFGLLCSCLVLAEGGQVTPLKPGMEPLLSWFNGAFTSREQASYDSRFTSAELRLMEIWSGYQGYRWVYAEQYLSQRAIRPFRQRIYRFSPAPDGRVLMAEFTMPMAIDFAGAWHHPKLLDSLTPQQLSLRHGCEIWLSRTPSGDYTGHTRVGHCSTDFGGATTLVQHIWIGPDYVRLLDRAYDNDGGLRWGSPAEGYVYLRRSGGFGQ
ncbi:chromophore lyase CpcT/CpeT [Aeromonas australiensis]|uniref:chromophore lyase CpcT/CpeT n=1 Tax=Aeromonas australiensis TaxID=1114880 RepID=UPI000589BB61|nr:chromophore lyase CpcT/CpeT [Aeromonas australiensis]